MTNNHQDIVLLNKNTRSLRCCFILLALALAVCSKNLRADTVDDWLLLKMAELKIPGLQIAVVNHNKLVKTANYGIANMQDSVAVDDNTLFTINSMTKGFTGIAIMQLVEQGKLQLTHKISQYLAELPEQWRDITVKQLLTHTSGLPDIMGDGLYIISNKDAQAAWDKVQQQPLEFKANSQFKYNQTNYLLLGNIITAVSGRPFSDFIIQNQLDKVGMPKTAAAGFAHFQDVIPHQARAYTYDITGSLSTVYAEFPPYLRASAGMSSNAIELARWVRALQNNQLFKHASSLATLWSPAILDNGHTAGFSRLLNGYALGWQVIDRPSHPAVALVGGNRAALAVYPQDQLTIVIITNLMGASPETFIDEIAAFYLDDMHSINGISLKPNILADYVGNYAFANFSISVSRETSGLSMLASGAGQEKFTIYATSDSHFFAKLIDATFEFQRDNKGAVNQLVMRQGANTLLAQKVN